jgi:hypothetical protein
MVRSARRAALCRRIVAGSHPPTRSAQAKTTKAPSHKAEGLVASLSQEACCLQQRSQQACQSSDYGQVVTNVLTSGVLSSLVVRHHVACPFFFIVVADVRRLRSSGAASSLKRPTPRGLVRPEFPEHTTQTGVLSMRLWTTRNVAGHKPIATLGT